MNNSYFYISEPEKKNQSNDELFSYYYHSIKWDVKMICGAGTSGYILQKVKILNTMPSIQLLFEPEVDIERNVVYKEYYEAWRVVDRKIIYSDSFDDRDDYDDIFLNKSKFFYLDDMLSESLGKEGIIAYTAEVYWIDINSSEYSIIDNWSNSVIEAGYLKSKLVKECAELKHLQTNLPIRNFTHYVNFKDEDTIKNTIERCYKWGLVNKYPEHIDTVKCILENSDYAKLLGKIFEKYQILE